MELSMNYGYIRVSTEKQSIDNQKYEIMKFIDERKLLIDRWVQETVSSRKKLQDRELGNLIDNLNSGDRLICTELSRLGRSLLEVMSILNILMEKQVKVYATKEGYELADNINSQVLAFAFSLAAQIERSMISSRTKEALDRKRADGKKLGRPKGSRSKSILDDKVDNIKELVDKEVPVSSIAKILGVKRTTLDNFIRTRKLM